MIVNPNNPTGSFLKDWERQSLFEISREKNLPIISDEVFMDYAVEDNPQRVATMIGSDVPLSFSLNGLSKSACMPQMKLAWITINGSELETQAARDRLEILLDTYLSANTPVQLALPELLTIGADLRAQVLTRARVNLAAAADLLVNSPANLLPTEGGWSCVVQLPRVMS